MYIPLLLDFDKNKGIICLFECPECSYEIEVVMEKGMSGMQFCPECHKEMLGWKLPFEDKYIYFNDKKGMNKNDDDNNRKMQDVSGTIEKCGKHY